MQIKNASLCNSIVNEFISELRDTTIQKDPLRFRTNIERIGQVLAYELSKDLAYQNKVIKTPLGDKPMDLLCDDVVICSILRAGLPLHQGVLSYFDKAENAFISAYRKHQVNSNEFEVEVNYFACPSIDDKIVILTDPMLATGKTLENVYQVLGTYGNPKAVHIIAVIGSKQGVETIKKTFPKNTTLWIATIDDKLNDKGYIIPGLGDAGDLCYGKKLKL